MHDDIQHHIAQLRARAPGDAERLIASLLAACWPGGGDRIDPAALGTRADRRVAAGVLVRRRALRGL
jgi:hypothetical protein